ncbi:MAG: efflux RND transporter periplasmic adaptor subunit [Gemmataceae bacterium]
MNRWRWFGSVLFALLLLLVAAFFLLPALGVPGLPNVLALFLEKKDSSEDEAPTVAPSVRLLSGEGDRFELDPAVMRTMGMGRPAQIAAGAAPRVLRLAGSLAFDPEYLVRVQSRFGGEVVALGTSEEPHTGAGGRTVTDQPLQYGSPVRKGQVLAVVWSKDLGEKKSDLIDSLLQLKLDQENLARLEELYRTGGTPEATIRQARRNLSADINAANKAERTLRIWKVTDTEIDAVKAEVKRIATHKGVRDPDREKDWARVEVTAPIDGVIVEKNVVRGNIVDTTADLFKVADMRHLAVYAHVYEEDLRSLQRLKGAHGPAPVPWRVYLASDPRRTPLASDGILRLGLVVDPNQHTDLVMGRVGNADGRLRVGQFVTAEVDMPAPPDVVSVPTAALDEDGETSWVIVQDAPAVPRFAARRVRVMQRFLDFAYVRSQLDPEEKKAGLAELHPGEWVVTAGAVELKAALEEAQARSRAGK